MQKHRFQVLRALALLILTVAALSLLTSCIWHRHSWTAWETEDGVTSRHCRRCGEIRRNKAALDSKGGQSDNMDLIIELTAKEL